MALIGVLFFSAAGIVYGMEFRHVMTFGSEGEGEGQFRYVEDFALAANGQDLLVTDAATAWVQVFDKKTGKFITRFGGKGDEDHNLDKPEGISADPKGNIWVADYNTGEVKIYDKEYKWIRTFSEYGSGPGQNMKSEFTDIYQGYYYMPEAGNHRVSVWDLDANFIFSFGKKGSGLGEMDNPEAAKFNSRGELIVSDLNNGRLIAYKVSPAQKQAEVLRTIGSPGSEKGRLKACAGVGIDKDDNMYVGEIGNDRVQVFSPDGESIAMWGKKGSGTGEFGNIHGVFVDKESGWVYVADTANNRVQVFSPIVKSE
ncbi:MAG: 6-bladed beta-propeller [Desulfobacterales bacterium]